jgi:hypothetical protein
VGSCPGNQGPRSSGDRAPASGVGCVGSNPTGGTGSDQHSCAGQGSSFLWHCERRNRCLRSDRENADRSSLPSSDPSYIETLSSPERNQTNTRHAEADIDARHDLVPAPRVARPSDNRIRRRSWTPSVTAPPRRAALEDYILGWSAERCRELAVPLQWERPEYDADGHERHESRHCQPSAPSHEASVYVGPGSQRTTRIGSPPRALRRLTRLCGRGPHPRASVG